MSRGGDNQVYGYERSESKFGAIAPFYWETAGQLPVPNAWDSSGNILPGKVAWWSYKRLAFLESAQRWLATGAARGAGGAAMAAVCNDDWNWQLASFRDSYQVGRSELLNVLHAGDGDAVATSSLFFVPCNLRLPFDWRTRLPNLYGRGYASATGLMLDAVDLPRYPLPKYTSDSDGVGIGYKGACRDGERVVAVACVHGSPQIYTADTTLSSDMIFQTSYAIEGNGRDFNLRNLPREADWISVSAGNGLTVALGRQAYSEYSDDNSVTWKMFNDGTPGVFDDPTILYRTVVFNTLYAAVSFNKGVTWSDGVGIVNYPDPVMRNTPEIIFSNGLFYIIGHENFIYASANPAADVWTAIPTTPQKIYAAGAGGGGRTIAIPFYQRPANETMVADELGLWRPGEYLPEDLGLGTWQDVTFGPRQGGSGRFMALLDYYGAPGLRVPQTALGRWAWE